MWGEIIPEDLKTHSLVYPLLYMTQGPSHKLDIPIYFTTPYTLESCDIAVYLIVTNLGWEVVTYYNLIYH